MDRNFIVIWLSCVKVMSYSSVLMGQFGIKIIR
jgi:hypothetical protein